MNQNTKNYLGFDFGASSGRAILGRLTLDGKKTLELEEVYRFPNEAIFNGKNLVWETERLFDEMKTAIRKTHEMGMRIDAIGVDTWGVDFGVIDESGKIVVSPIAYRDERTNGLMEEAYKTMSKADIFKNTGLAFMQFNTLYQILAMKKDPELSKYVDERYTLLFMPDLFEYYLTGKTGTEYTIASTSQMIDPTTRTWSENILNAFGIPKGFLAPIQQPGTMRGYLRKEICPEIDYDIPVFAVGAHDTASAVASVPARKGENFAYISSGTWSLMGVETLNPICSETVMEANFTNEGGLNGTTRMLKNIMGLWIIQECRKQFNEELEAAGKDKLSFADIVKEVESVKKTCNAVIDVDDNAFFAPDGMADRIVKYLADRGIEVGEEEKIGKIADIVYRSLALKYRWAIECIENITGTPIDVLYIVGGGGKNELLNQYTAQALKRPVRIGAGEGTVIGNLLVQAIGTGDVKDLWELRQIVRDSFGDKQYTRDESQDAAWDADYKKLLELMK